MWVVNRGRAFFWFFLAIRLIYPPVQQVAVMHHERLWQLLKKNQQKKNRLCEEDETRKRGALVSWPRIWRAILNRFFTGFTCFNNYLEGSYVTAKGVDASSQSGKHKRSPEHTVSTDNGLKQMLWLNMPGGRVHIRPNTKIFMIIICAQSSTLPKWDHRDK